MTLHNMHFIEHFYRSEPDEELQLKLIFTKSKVEREMLQLEINRREQENAKL